MSGRTAIVVGGSGAIGQAVVERLDLDGLRLLSVARNPGPGAGRIKTLALDVLDDDLGARLRSAADDALDGELDILVWCVGTLGTIGPTRAVETEDMLRLYREHVTGFLEAVRALADLLDRSEAPSVVAFSGGGATAPFPRYTPYAAAKAALVRVVENLAQEEPGWRVNAIAPGFVASRMHEVTLSAGAESVGEYFDETRRRLEQPVPPEAAANLVAFLATPAAAGISGRLLSAPWDPWSDPDWIARLRSHGSLGRLRRVDDQWITDRREDE